MGNPITHNREVAKNNMITSIHKVSENGEIRGINNGKLRWQNQNSSPNPTIQSFKSMATTRKRIELNITNAP